jgi:uncharacterized protein DUF6152
VKYKWLFGICLAVATLISTPGLLLAHHSMSMYDRDRVVTLKGTIVTFAWSNPHAQVHFESQDDKGNVETWTADCPSPSRLARAGWSMETLKPGDRVTIIGNQAKDGSNTMRLDRVVLPGGQEMSAYH